MKAVNNLSNNQNYSENFCENEELLSSVPSTSFASLDVQVEIYPIRKIVKSMMYSYGDSEEVVESCVDFMLMLIYEQLTNLIRKAEELCKIRK